MKENDFKQNMRINQNQKPDLYAHNILLGKILQVTRTIIYPIKKKSRRHFDSVRDQRQLAPVFVFYRFSAVTTISPDFK